MSVEILSQNEPKVKTKSALTTEALHLADDVLDQANRYRIEWLATGCPQSWRLWQACIEDRETLLAEVGDG